ncbi:nitroreductase [Lutimaribacter sp. EGI FJ00015]|uniref:Nitroreductase n=1 Tax=Lutimaribacter degradans TaxID=2945989 RepID=A0ACC5ZWI8_9RHOB|nr:nitroreductase [Lutimaribacter sp. EGI FJ00013]MCM2562687.1 nitroreductase [Lutimaribacter sp. EGI FJ00013]MCO0613844.1 nitroreductase [Lutimaribacter sp. EGI FJ00015]MCO0636673.1 nitroreductase [Lutimaribacter sp. EGI FJ00014]
MTAAHATLLDLLSQRHSCRGFRPDPLPADTITRIVETAQRVPSWCNAQPWQVSVTQPPATKRLSTALLEAVEHEAPKPDLDWPSQYTGIYQERRRTCGFQLYEAVGIARDDRAGRTQQMLENYRFFNAPHVAIISSEADLGAYGAMDSGGFVAAFTLAAQALGVATIPQAAIAAYAPTVRAVLNIPDTRLILCGIALGLEDPDHPANTFRTERADPAQVIDWVEN